MRTLYLDVLAELRTNRTCALYYPTTVEAACRMIRDGFFLGGQTMYMHLVDRHELAGQPDPLGPVLLVLDAERIGKVFNGPATLSSASRPDQRGGASDSDPDAATSNSQRSVALIGGEPALPFKDCLSQIVLDDPAIENPMGVQYYHTAAAALRRAMFSVRLDVPIVKRACAPGCGCLRAYDAMGARLGRLFEAVVDPAAGGGR